MKMKYTLTVAGYEMNVLSDDHPDDIDEIVSSLDRTIRTLCARNRNLPVIEATMLAALDACAEKKKLQRRIHQLEHELYDDGGEAAKMRRELELLRAYIGRHKVSPVPMPADDGNGYNDKDKNPQSLADTEDPSCYKTVNQTADPKSDDQTTDAIEDNHAEAMNDDHAGFMDELERRLRQSLNSITEND